jgi:molybdopterin converting factor small subunit
MALVSSLAAQCMFALGVLVPRDTQQVYVNLDEARYTIDLLTILREKTQGNLTEEESGQLTATIAELQQVYVARVQQAQEQAMQQAGIDLNNLKGQPPK